MEWQGYVGWLESKREYRRRSIHASLKKQLFFQNDTQHVNARHSVAGLEIDA